MSARRVVLMLALLCVAPVGAAPAASVAPLLAWTDAPPATEVRPLSGARTIALRYGAALDPATFHATLDGERVSDAFHPEPGTSETVTLAFIGGGNRLVLQASSADGLVHVTLERTIVFARFPGDENAAQRVPSAPELKHEVWKQNTPVAEQGPAAPTPASAPAPTPTTRP